MPYNSVQVTCAVHLRLIGNPVVDFLLVIIELFALGVTAEALQRRGATSDRYRLKVGV